MILEIKLHIREGFWMVSCDDLPGLNLCGDENVLTDFVGAWRKMHEVAPTQVMPVPRSTTLYKRAAAKRKKTEKK